MTDDRRMTTDRFYGGVSHRLQNLRSMLVFVRDEHPTREELNKWVISNTQAGSSDAVSHHLTFLDSIRIIELSTNRCNLDKYGQQWLQDQNVKTLYEALRSGVKGFDTILEALQDEAMTDEDIMNLLIKEFEEANMSKPGPAIRHREWLQVLDLVERKEGVNRITPAGRELISNTKELSSETIETERSDLEVKLDEEPQLTEEEERYTESRRRARDAAFSQLVRQAYNNKCAICGNSRETPDGNPEVEAAHIYPKQSGGTDDVRNGLALCKLHHWAFDTGWIAISDDYKILVKDSIDQEGYYEFKQLEGEKLHLPDNEDARPHQMFLEHHRELQGF